MTDNNDARRPWPTRAASSTRLYSLGALLTWGLLLAASVLAGVFSSHFRPWIQMWILVVSLFLAAKWMTLRALHWQRFAAGRLLAYVLLWPGMDAPAFCANHAVPRPSRREWRLAAVETAFGAAMLWGGTRWIGPISPLLTGWLGMIGLVFVLHFGLFHLLSLCWRARGIKARPIMHAPGAATSLSEFWGGSWNVAFRDLMHWHVFKPLARRVGAGCAGVLVFALSGGLHEVVISLPARAGFGLPTGYFLLQALGMWFERSTTGQRLGMGEGRRGWCFVLGIAGLPAFWLFHPPFIHHVILPMLNDIGAI